MEQADAASVMQGVRRRTDLGSREAARPCLYREEQSEHGLPACGSRPLGNYSMDGRAQKECPRRISASRQRYSLLPMLPPLSQYNRYCWRSRSNSATAGFHDSAIRRGDVPRSMSSR